MSQRIGHGYDVHATTTGDHVMLAGVRVPAAFGLRAHSDGDVVLHALCDALLGAAALGDIGRHFPDDDPAWRGAAGTTLLARTQALVAAEGWRAVNADLTIIAERPRLRDHIDAMRAAVAAGLCLPPTAVNCKATTHEGLGALGRGEGLAAHAVTLLESV